MGMRIDAVQRLAKSLEPIAQVSKLHAFQIVNSILAMFDEPFAQKPPARISDLFTLLFELLQELEMPLPQDKIEALSPWNKGSSKTAKVVKQMLAFQPETPFDFDAVLMQALEQRMAAPRVLLA